MFSGTASILANQSNLPLPLSFLAVLPLRVCNPIEILLTHRLPNIINRLPVQCYSRKMPPGHPAPSSSLATFKTRLSSLLQLLWNDFFCIILLYYPAPSSSFATFKTRLSSSLQLLWIDFFCIILSLLCFSIFPVQLFLFSIFAKCPSVQIFLLPVRRSVWVSFLLSATFLHHSFQLKRHFHIKYLFCCYASLHL